MATEFTTDQLKAIETIDKSVLVSAAAGSGKTSVLIERIIRIITEGKANVDEMLVVTFTNAAASEMRLRLAAAIRKRMAAEPEDAPRMKEQLSRLYKAYISTIDSFALRVIREFFHETDLEPSFGVCDDVRAELMRREALSELFEDAFADDELIEGGSFRSFLRLYSEERSDEGFMEDMLKAYSALRSMPDYFEWAHKKAELLRVTPDNFEGSALQKIMLDDARESFGNAAGAFRRLREIFEGSGLGDMYEDKLGPQEDAVAGILSELSEGRLDDDVIAKMEAIPSVTLRSKKQDQEAYQMIKPEVDELREIFKKETGDFKKRYLIPDFKSRLAEMNATYEYTIYYIRMLEEFESRYEAKKQENKVIDFADMEHYAVRILKNDEASDILRKRFRFIFVDEYQDTNNIQETLISRVARPDNVFRVGDVKQSIYKFRQAEPEIFERLYAEYKKTDNRDGTVIDLGRNFRTNERTVRYINRVFSKIMDGYDESAMLYTEKNCDDEYDFIPEVHLLTEETGGGDDYEALPEMAAGLQDELEDGGIEDLTKEEAEAEYIAGIVESIIGTEFFDTKARVVRRAEAKDIAILFRAVRYRGEVMSRALRERSIEPHIEESGEYFDSVEIGTALSLLRCVDNMKGDVPLISVLHSEVFGFGPEELAKIRIAHSEHIRNIHNSQDESGSGSASAKSKRYAYWEAFGWFISDGPEGQLKEKAKAASERILEWRELSRMLPLADFVWKLLVDSGCYRMAGAMSGGSRRQANLRNLADRAGSFSEGGIASLSSFISFLDLLRSRKISTAQTPTAGKDDNVVRITTIHKSKGLEYPFVIVGGLGHRFRFDNNEKGFSFDSEAGIGMPYVDPSRKYWRSTIIQRAINSKSRRDAYREELRLLYVAMTRARNRLYMVGTCKREEELFKFTPRPANYISAMRDVLRTPDNRYVISPLKLSKGPADRAERDLTEACVGVELSDAEKAIYEEIERRFSFTYPDAELLAAKAKYSVSEIRRAEAAAEAGSSRDLSAEDAAALSEGGVPQPRKRTERRGRASAADIGTAYHRIMEFLDFTKVTDSEGGVDSAYIAERAGLLNERGAIDDEVFGSVDLRKIEEFFESGIGRRTIEAAGRGVLMREKPFTLRTVRGGKEMLVQGVIDCCFEENGQMVLIDYKSGFVRPGRRRDVELGRIKREYGTQIDLYSEAVKKGSGMDVKEAYLYLFMSGEALSMLQ